MRSFLTLSQKSHLSNAIKFIEQSAQMIIYLAVMGVLAYLYVTFHGMIVTFLGGLDLTKIPNY